jgi:hypothetical protein
MKKAVLWTLAGLVPASMIAAVVLGSLYSRQPTPPPTVDVDALSPDQILARMKSGELQALAPEDRRAAVHKLTEDRETFHEMMQDDTVSDEERNRLRETMRETFREEQQARVQEYFALPKEERDAYMDKLADEMADRFQRWQQDGQANRPPRDDNANAANGERRGPSLDRMKERIESSDPVERAQQAEFRRVMREKMEARGINGPGGGGHRGG